MLSDAFSSLPELHRHAQLIRIPGELDVPITHRVRAIIDTAAFQRLKHISQLGLVSHVYPGALHSRFEHSLGVYRLAGVTLTHLHQHQPEFTGGLSSTQFKRFLLAALLHDVGHWPYCHPIEDMQLEWVPRHEALARNLICGDELRSVIEGQWQVDAASVADFLSQPADTPGDRVLQNLMNGPIDIDKMDYLQRDSLHAGVPYGRNFDAARLIGSMRVNSDGASIVITEKGKTAAEMMVFARYVMFSEVYWHHAVRSATAMLQRLVFHLGENRHLGEQGCVGKKNFNSEAWLQMSDAEFGNAFGLSLENDIRLSSLAQGLFSSRRRLFKRVAQYNFSANPELHRALGRRPYIFLVHCGEVLASKLSQRLARPLAADDVLIDAPPVKLEVQFNLLVQQFAQADQTDTEQARSPSFPSHSTSIPLAEISPVVRALATDQFDNYVKRIRVFISPDRAQELSVSPSELTEMLLDSVQQLAP